MAESAYPVKLSYGSPEQATPPGTPDGIRLTLPDVAGLENLPLDGYITFRYHRDNLSLSTRGDAKLAAELCLLEVTEVEAEEGAPEKTEEPALDAMFKEAQKAEAELPEAE